MAMLGLGSAVGSAVFGRLSDVKGDLSRALIFIGGVALNIAVAAALFLGRFHTHHAQQQTATSGGDTGACPYNRPCAQQYVGKSQSCMVISGRLIVHAPVQSRRFC